MKIEHAQTSLFDLAEVLPNGLVYQPDFITEAEEGALLAKIRQLPLNEARFKQYTARRRVVRYGEGDYPASYGSDAEKANPRRRFPDFLISLRRKVAKWLGLLESDFVHALVTEYKPGTPIGWHIDSPHFETVVGVSLAGSARMRFRPSAAKNDGTAGIELELAPRSVYVMRSNIRWDWQHHIPPTKQLRYSITLRTLRCTNKVANPVTQ